MKPILYGGDEIEFTNNGIGRLNDCVSCVVTEERNGIYECEFTYPVTGPLFSIVKEGNIIGVIHDDKHDIQPFDIYAHSAPIDGLVTFYARHISYRLRNVILKPFTATSCADALNQMQRQTYNPNPFKFWTNKSVNGPYEIDVPSAIRAKLAGEQGSILDVYGKGEYEYDKWAVRLYVDRGNDNGVTIRYGYNMTDITQEVNEGDIFSAVAPFWKSTEGEQVVTLPEGYIVSPNMPIKLFPWTTDTGDIMTNKDGEILEFAVPQIIVKPLDLSSEFEEAPTIAELRALAETMLANSNGWLPNENITVSFVDLAHTKDYESVAALQRVSLCDRVGVYCGPIGVDAVSMQVIRVVYDVLGEKYTEIELGSPRQTYAQTIMQEVNDSIGESVTIADLENAVDNATTHITGAQDSHVRFIYDANGGLQEIVIMDTDDIATATKVWRWNSGGLGYSTNGYSGPYTTAITQDGAIVADFITTGTLTAVLIKAGVLRPANGNTNNYWNMETGEFSLRSDGATNGIIYKNGVLVINAGNITTGTLSADRILGGTLTLGGSNNTNGVLRVLDANGNVIGTWNKDGINATKGTFSGALNAATGTFAGNLAAAGGTFTGTLSASCINGGTLNCNNMTVTNLKAESISGVGSSPFSGQFSAYRYYEQGGLEIEEESTLTFTNGILTNWTGYS